MSLALFFLHTALHNLRRGGQRALAAAVCIAFGVMSLTAMHLLSHAISRVMLIDARLLFGADISLGRWNEDYLLPEHVQELEQLRQTGEIERYTLLAYSSLLTFHKVGSGEVYFATGLGVNPSEYPLLGTLEVGQPGYTGVGTLLNTAQDVLVTRDLAVEKDLAVGDRIVLADLELGIPVEGQIRGIVRDTPNHAGGKIYYTMGLARALAGQRPPENVALVLAPHAEELAGRLHESGWFATSAPARAHSDKEEDDLINILLKGAGMLGLMVGGVGIANTMHVLLRRRQTELAIWKTLGYGERHLRLLFVIEASLLGLAGSLLGLGLGVLISIGLVELFSRTSNLLMEWSFDPTALVLGGLAGIATTVIFALWAILIAARVQPMALLRNEPVAAARLSWRAGISLALLLALPFSGLASLVMGSIVSGVGVLLFALAGFLVLGGVLGGATWLAARLLPLRRFPLAQMAQKRLGRGGLGMVFAMIALFAGIVSLGLGAAFTQNAVQAMEERIIETVEYPITIMVSPDQSATVEEALRANGTAAYNRGSTTPLRAVIVPGAEAESCPPRNCASQGIALTLIGRSQPDDLIINGAPWGESPSGVYVSAYTSLNGATEVEIELWDGTRHRLDIVGTYAVEWNQTILPQASGLLMPLAVAEKLAKPDTIHFFVQPADGKISQAAATLGEALPHGMVVNRLAYAARYTQSTRNLFVLAVAMSGLALLAGVLLVANSVSLAMLDRRYEIGILKAVGYSRHHIWLALGVEYGLAAGIASLAGVAVVQGLMLFLALVNGLAARLLTIDALTSVGIGLVGISLTLLTVLAATWEPVQASPLTALNDRE